MKALYLCAVARAEEMEDLADGELVREGDLSAIVATEEIDVETLNERLADLDWVTERALRHDRLVRQAACASAVPIRFGAIYFSEQDLRTALREREREFRQALERVRGKSEWSVIVHLDRKRLAEHIEKESPRIAEAVAAIGGATPGQAFLLKKKLQGLVAEEMNEAICEIVAEVKLELGRACVDLKPLPVAKGSTKNGEAPVAALAALVSADGSAFLDQAGKVADALAARGVKLGVVGPMPPYSFASGGGE